MSFTLSDLLTLKAALNFTLNADSRASPFKSKADWEKAVETMNILEQEIHARDWEDREDPNLAMRCK